jgi:replicative DNA helicase
VIAARPGVGKSSFVTNVARNVAVDAGLPVAMFSLEMSRWEIGMRLLCGEARVPWDSIRNKRVGAEDWSRIAQAADSLHEAPLFIVDSGNVTLVDIRAKARRLSARRAGLGMIIVDYLQLMSHTRRVDNRQQEIAEISRRSEDARQGARDPGDRRLAAEPRPRAPSGQAAAALGPAGVRRDRAGRRRGDVHPPRGRGPGKKGLADLIVAKHRNGPTDTVPLTFLPHLTQFRNHATAVT